MIDGKNLNQNFEQALDEMREAGDRSKFEQKSQEIIDIYKNKAIKNFLAIGGLLRSSEDLDYIKENLPKLEEATQELTGYTYSHLLKCYYPRELPFFDSSSEYQAIDKIELGADLFDFDVDDEGRIYFISHRGLALGGTDPNHSSLFKELGYHTINLEKQVATERVLVIDQENVLTACDQALNFWKIIDGEAQAKTEIGVCRFGSGEAICDVAVYPNGDLGVLTNFQFIILTKESKYHHTSSYAIKNSLANKSLQILPQHEIFYCDNDFVYKNTLDEGVNLGLDRSYGIIDFQLTSDGQYFVSRQSPKSNYVYADNIYDTGRDVKNISINPLSEKNDICSPMPNFIMVAERKGIETYRQNEQNWIRVQTIKTNTVGQIKKVRACKNGNIYAMARKDIAIITRIHNR